MTKFENGKTYRLINKADKQRRTLNAYCASVPASLTNVCLYTNDEDDECQKWQYVGDENRGYFVCKANTALALDLYTGGKKTGVKNHNAHLFKPSETSYVIPIYTYDADGQVACVKFKSECDQTKFLTANENANGTSSGVSVRAKGNVYWYKSEGVTPNSQDWLVEEVSEVGTVKPIAPPKSIEDVDIMCRYDSPLIFKGEEICINKVQNDKSHEKYHRGSGFKPSESGKDFLETQKGAEVLYTIREFAKKVFKISEDLDRNRCAYYLFGEYDSKAKFHAGVDIDVADGKKIYAFWGGKIVSVGGSYGRVQIYNANLGVTMAYLHLKNIPDDFYVGKYISAGDYIGRQSNKSMQNIKSHLHFEVRKGESTSVSNSLNSSSGKPLGSIIPYGYMKKYPGE